MERQGDEVHIETNEARGGSTPHVVRYVLFFGLLLAIIAMSVIWITGASNSAAGTGGIAESSRAANEPDNAP